MTSPFSESSTDGNAGVALRNGHDSAFGGTESDSMLEDEDDSSTDEHFSSMDRMKKPRIMLMGLKRSGKSSIQKVVFQKMSPNETLFLESTTRITKEDVSSSSFIQFQVWEYPGQMNAFDPNFDASSVFEGCGAVIYIIDAQEDYSQALKKLIETVTKAHKINDKLRFEIFIHKVDSLSEESKIEVQRDIYHRTNEDLVDANLESVHLSFYLTSIYDHSIFEAFSKVVQKLIPQLPALERLLDIFISNANIEKAFLFDVASKIYVATDASPVDMQSYELCCDMIDVAIDISSIYGFDYDGPDYGGRDDQQEQQQQQPDSLMLDISAVIKLNNSTVLCLKELNRYLALVCIMRLESFDRQGGMSGYNFDTFKAGIENVFESNSSNNTSYKNDSVVGQQHKNMSTNISGQEQQQKTDSDSHFSTEESQLDR